MEKLLCDLNPPSALGALSPGAPAASLALLIPVLLMHARHLPGGLVVLALCCWLPELMCVLVLCFSSYFHRKESKNLLQEYGKGQDLLLGHVHMHLFL